MDIGKKKLSQQQKEQVGFAQKQSIMKGLNYSLAELRSIQKSLMDVGDKNLKQKWALGGFMVTVVSQVINIMNTVISDSIDQAVQGEKQSSIEDIRTIQARLNAVFDDMCRPLDS